MCRDEDNGGRTAGAVGARRVDAAEEEDSGPGCLSIFSRNSESVTGNAFAQYSKFGWNSDDVNNVDWALPLLAPLSNFSALHRHLPTYLGTYVPTLGNLGRDAALRAKLVLSKHVAMNESAARRCHEAVSS